MLRPFSTKLGKAYDNFTQNKREAEAYDGKH